MATLGYAPPAAVAQCLPPFCVESTPTPGPSPSPAPGDAPPNRPAPVNPLAPVTGSVAEDVDPAHTNWVPGDSVVAPLRVRWTRRLAPSRVLSGDGRLYGVAGAKLRALDPSSGRDLWTVPIAPSSFVAAFDAGRVFVIANDGTISAHGAADGAQLWSQKLDPYSSLVSLVAGGGVVYAAVDNDIVALDGGTGDRYWSVQLQASPGIPTLDDSGVYSTFGCDRLGAWDRLQGAPRWTTDSECGGGGGGTAALAGGRLYVQEHTGVYDAASGAKVGTYGGGTPILADGTLVLRRLSGPESDQKPFLTATDLASGRRLWRKRSPFGAITMGLYQGTADPIALGQAVFSLEEGTLSARSLRSGALLWKDRPRIGPLTNDLQSAELTAAPGVLIVNGRGRMTAYESFFSPPPGGIEVAVARIDVLTGATVRIAGQAGAERRTGRVAIEVDRAGRGGYRTVARPAVRPDGSFSARVRADRNLRLRAVKDGVRARPVTVFVYPRLRFRVRQAGGRAIATVTMTGARDVRLAGRRLVLYLGRRHAKRYQRLGSAQLRSAGRGKGIASVSFTPLRRVGGKDFLTACVPGQARLGLGRSYDLARHCGAASVRFRR